MGTRYSIGLVGSRQSSSKRAGDEQREGSSASHTWPEWPEHGVLYERSQLPHKLIQNGPSPTQALHSAMGILDTRELSITMSLPRAILGSTNLHV